MDPSPLLNRKDSIASNIDIDPHIYKLPTTPNITKGVLCKLYAVSVVCVIFLIAEVIGGILS